MYTSGVLNRAGRNLLHATNKTVFCSYKCNFLNTCYNEHYTHNLKCKSKLNNRSIRMFSEIKALKCWKCGIEKKSILELFCDQCNVIQNPQQNENYFKIFGLPEAFNIDSKALTNQFRSMQSVLHPDKFTNK